MVNPAGLIDVVGRIIPWRNLARFHAELVQAGKSTPGAANGASSRQNFSHGERPK